MVGRAFAVVVLAVVLGFASGCADPGDRAAAAQLRRLQTSLFNEAQSNFRRGSDPVVLARWATNDSGTVEPGNGETFTSLVEALSWSSTDGLDGVVDLRLTVTTPGFQARSFNDRSYGPGSASACVRFEVGGDATSTDVECDGRPALAVPPAPKPKPPLSEAALRRAMERPTLAAAEAAAVKAYPGLSVTAEVVDGSWAVVVVRSAPDLACLGGTRSPSGTVVVSSPTEIRPGEGDCDPARFVRGHG